MRQYLLVRFAMLAMAIACIFLGSRAIAAQHPDPEPMPAGGGLYIAVITLSNMPVEAAAQQARLLLSDRGTVLTDERTSRIIVKDTLEHIDKVRAFLKGGDTPLPMVSLRVDYGARNASSQSQVGVDGVVVVNGRTHVGVTANSGSSSTVEQGEMRIVTMSGSEAVLNVGEVVPIPVAQYFFDYARGLGMVAQGVVFQEVSSGFGVVPRVISADEVVLRVYPRIAYKTAAGPGVLRFIESASEIRARNGETVQIASSASDNKGLFTRILGTGSFKSSDTSAIRVTPTVMNYP